MIIKSRDTRFIWGLFVLACVIRLVFFLVFTCKSENYLIHFDSAQYINLAENIYMGKGITNTDETPQFYRLPGYSIFLALCYKIFGHDYIYVLFVQIMLASLIPILIFYLARMLFPKKIRIAQVSSIISCIHVGFVLYAGMIATETLFTLFFLGFLIAFFKALEQYSSKQFFLAGILLGCASMIRPVGIFILVLAVVLAIFFAFVFPSTSSPTPIGDPGKTPNLNPRDINSNFERKNVSIAWIPGQARDDVRESVALVGKKLYPRNIVLLIFGWLIIVIPWLARNFILSGFIFFHTLPGLHFLQYSATKIIMQTSTHDKTYVQARKRVLSQWDDAIKKQENNLGRSLHEYEKCVIGEKITYGYMKQYPMLGLKNACIEMLKTCCALYSAQIIISDTGVWPDYGPGVSFLTKIKRFLLPEVNHKYLIPIIYWDILVTILILLGCLGFVCLSIFDSRLRMQVFKLAPFIALMILLTLAYGCARLRLPIEPLLLILATSCGFFMFDIKR